MNTGEVAAVRAKFCKLWPQSRWTEDEWSVVYEKAARIGIDSAQAEAAMRNLKATIDGCPSVAVLLGALKQAEGPKVVQVRREVLEAVQGYPHDLDENGHTSFERRVLEDPAFAKYARQAGRLPKSREAAIKRGETGTTKYLTAQEQPA